MRTIIGIHHGCEGRIKKIRPEDRRLASRGLLSYSHTNNGLNFLLTIRYHILFLKRLQEVPEYAEMRHAMMITWT